MSIQSHSSLLGTETFKYAGQPVGFSVIDFWRFQFSNIWDIQDQIAEFIVAKTLGQTEPYNKNGWTLWDINYRGQRIEVKETAYYHSWRNYGKFSSRFALTQEKQKNPLIRFSWIIGVFGSCLQKLSIVHVVTIKQSHLGVCKNSLIRKMELVMMR